jgi:hypothetical protein
MYVLQLFSSLLLLKNLKLLLPFLIDVANVLLFIGFETGMWVLFEPVHLNPLLGLKLEPYLFVLKNIKSFVGNLLAVVPSKAIICEFSMFSILVSFILLFSLLMNNFAFAVVLGLLETKL